MGAALCFAKVCTREKGDQPSRRVTARIIARPSGLAPCALCRCDNFSAERQKGRRRRFLYVRRRLGLIRQLLDRMGKGRSHLALIRRCGFMSEMLGET